MSHPLLMLLALLALVWSTSIWIVFRLLWQASREGAPAVDPLAAAGSLGSQPGTPRHTAPTANGATTVEPIAPVE